MYRHNSALNTDGTVILHMVAHGPGSCLSKLAIRIATTDFEEFLCLRLLVILVAFTPQSTIILP